MEKTIIKLPRLYSDQDINSGLSIELDSGQAHYLKNVLRRNAGDQIRLFNGRHGEWLCEIEFVSKKSITVSSLKQIRAQKEAARRVHIFFPPIKKQRMDILIEKSVELGATDLHPILTQNTETRKINQDRIHAQIIEAAEQCERLDMPVLHDLCDFQSVTNMGFSILAAVERIDAQDIKDIDVSVSNDIGFMAGPEGGFTAEEREFIEQQNCFTMVSLGSYILRSETAFLKFLSII